MNQLQRCGVVNALSSSIHLSIEGVISIMDIAVEQGDITKVQTDAICLGIFEGVQRPGGAAGAVDRALDGAISEVLADRDFRARRAKSSGCARTARSGLKECS
jgi:O-acetyl-ADP-ribose deacetylase (regulator of RNase III)